MDNKAAIGATADILLAPLVAIGGLILKVARRIGLNRLPLSRSILLRVGVLPIRNHYYEPFTDPRQLRNPPDQVRDLPGIDWNIDEQLALLGQLRYRDELRGLDTPKTSPLDFRLNNGSFESGDAEYLYQIVRHLKPRRLFEVGSGNSTLIARQAIQQNRKESRDYACEHLCIEPFEAPWLEQAGVTVLRQRVEEVSSSLFDRLERGDLLFIDSSHVIRPQGDVLVEYLQILPRLKPGVIVHVHDVFSPRDYPKEWMIDRLAFWNEQYLLEALLTGTSQWKIIGALNLLCHDHFERFREVCPYVTRDREPGSFYMQKLA